MKFECERFVTDLFLASCRHFTVNSRFSYWCIDNYLFMPPSFWQPSDCVCLECNKKLLVVDSWLDSVTCDLTQDSTPLDLWLHLQLNRLTRTSHDMHESCFPGTRKCIDVVSVYHVSSPTILPIIRPTSSSTLNDTCTGMWLFFVFSW